MVVRVTLPVALVFMLTETVLSLAVIPVSEVTSRDRLQAISTPEERVHAAPVAQWDCNM